MNERKAPYQKIIFVCTHIREGETACSNPERGSDAGFELVEKLREEVKKRGLKGKIRVAKSGCMDVCARGPNIMVFEEDGKSTWINEVSQADLPQIVEKYIPSEPKPS